MRPKLTGADRERLRDVFYYALRDREDAAAGASDQQHKEEVSEQWRQYKKLQYKLESILWPEATD